MTNAETATSLQVQRRFDAPRARVFDAWTNADVLREWWSAMPTMSPGRIDVDLREGGRYRMEMVTEEGDVHAVVGEYMTVDRPNRITYTWTWESNAAAMAGSDGTLVDVEFADDGDGTLVTLTHSGFGNAEIAGLHEHGWNGTLEMLARYLDTH